MKAHNAVLARRFDKRQHRTPERKTPASPKPWIMDVEIERRILGGLLADSRYLDKVPDLTPEHWSDYRHQIIFDAMLKLSRRHSPVDAKLVVEFLGVRKLVDWPGYVQELLKAAAKSQVPIEALLLRR